MIKFGIILLASYACGSALPPSSKPDSSLKTPQQAPGNYNPPKACICTLEYRPVCGTDGKTYGNQCELNCIKTENPDLKKRHEGPCADMAQKGQQLPNSTSKSCMCPIMTVLVCGTDGKTYANACFLNCEKAQNPALEKKHNGPCETSEPKGSKLAKRSVPISPCVNEYLPVCGSDGVTYDNYCELTCAAKNKPGLAKVHNGSCVAVPQQSNSCQCSEDNKPVCGSDGKTYPNNCSLDCQKTKNPSLNKSHDGPCSEVSEQINQYSCQCTKQKMPVCGTDHVTYSNICLLNCAANTKPVEKKSDGPCVAMSSKGVQPPKPFCPCPRIYDPVCGSDGLTYVNYCELECARKEKPGLTKVHHGRCGHQQPADNVKS